MKKIKLKIIYIIIFFIIIILAFDIRLKTVFYNLESNKINNDNVFKFATYAALIVSMLTVANDFNISIPFVLNLPFASFGFNWIVPVVIAGFIGNFIPDKNVNSIQNK